MTTDLTHTCPRCSGFANAFRHHGNVNGGRCLLCNGALRVTAAQARAFIAAQFRSTPAPRADEDTDTTPGARRTAERVVRFGEIVTTIRRYVAPSGAVHFTLSTESDVGTLVSAFNVDGGRVTNPQVCNGHLTLFGGKRGFVTTLQNALRT